MIRPKIPLMKHAFLHEVETKQALADFIVQAEKLSMGSECESFEQEFAMYQGAKHAVLFNSGSSANLAIMQVLKNLEYITDDSDIGVSALTWATNVMPILQLGMRPVVIDCDPQTLNVMSRTLQTRLETHAIQALFITNALGFAGDLPAIQEICEKNNIVLVEDNCEALGTEVGARKTGAFGLMASFSFFVAHHMSTVEGGMVCTDDDACAQMLRIVRANGWDRNLSGEEQATLRKQYGVTSEFESKYTFYDLGFNFRPTEITGFIGRYQLAFLPDNVIARQKNYECLESIVRCNSDLTPLNREHLSVLSCFAFPVLCKTRDLKEKYIKRFRAADIEIRPMIAGNIQKQPFYQKYVTEICATPGADMVHDCGFYCGNYPELTSDDLQVIAGCLKK